MHETSPGRVDEHELSIRSDNKSDFNGAKTKTNLDMDEVTVKNENIEDEGDDSDSKLRIYDDPCELMDGAPIFRMPRSRSWFCCPSSEAFRSPQTSAQSNNIFYDRCPDYPLVTEAPRIQFHAVGFRHKHQQMFDSKFPRSTFARRPPTGLNWIYDIILA
jgi:hypothetical protein